VLSDPQYFLLLYLASEPQRWHARTEVNACGAFKCKSPTSSVWLQYARRLESGGLVVLERHSWVPCGGYAARITAKGLRFLGYTEDVQGVALS
jgi:hypothetical protein